jgi:hypothetical protein
MGASAKYATNRLRFMVFHGEVGSSVCSGQGYDDSSILGYAGKSAMRVRVSSKMS